MSKLILYPQEIKQLDPEILGGKGVNLVHLFQKGFKIPPFFLISTTAYERFVTSSGAVKFIEELKAGWTKKGVSGCIITIQKVVSLFEKAPFEKTMEHEINEELQLFFESTSKKNSLAVRSSATVEDLSNYSFAGIFETTFGGCQTLFERIKKCWTSIWKESALFYFEKIGMKPWEVRMGVIVQEAIPAGSSGVLFTTFQTSEMGDVLRIEANWGLGTTLVSAKSSPDVYLLSKENSKALQKVLGNKERFATIKDGNELTEILTPDSQRHKFVLKDKHLKSLAQISKQVESLFGQPQDVEWAFWQKEFYLVQSRPITKSRIQVQPKVKRFWTSFFFLERFPQPVSPLGWTVLEGPVIYRALQEPLRLLARRDLANEKLTRLFYGRPYTDLNVFRFLYGFIPLKFLSPDKQELIALSGGKPPSLFERLYLYIPFLIRVIAYDSNWVFIFHVNNWKNFTYWYWAKIKKLTGLSLSSLGKELIFDKLLEAQNLTDKFLKLHRWSITYADVFFQLLNLLCRIWFKRYKDIHAVSLLSGVEGNLTVEMNLELWELSRLCAQNTALNEFFLKEKPKSLEKIESCPSSTSFLKAYQKFLEKFGHRSNSLDIYYSTWSEDSTYILEVLRKFLEIKDENNPAQAEAFRREQQKAYTDKALRKLSERLFNRIFPFKKMMFIFVLRHAKFFVLFRENQRFYWQMSIAQMRRIALELGKRIFLEGKVEETEDVFFIKLQELKDYIENGKELDWQEVIAQRKSEFKNHQNKTVPNLIKELEDGSLDFEFGSQKSEIYHGMPISPGKASGRARFIPDLREFEQIKKGDILVTQSLDPGWTPIFGFISGLVMEVGGMLSHGSILAREFGIPAVSNVSGLQRKIKDGDEIVVDGNMGQVFKISTKSFEEVNS